MKSMSEGIYDALVIWVLVAMLVIRRHVGGNGTLYPCIKLVHQGQGVWTAKE